MVVLHSSGPGGVYYVETKGLDGETNLKLRGVHPKIQEEYVEKDVNINADVQCDFPNFNLYKFEGKIALAEDTQSTD